MYWPLGYKQSLQHLPTTITSRNTPLLAFASQNTTLRANDFLQQPGEGGSEDYHDAVDYQPFQVRCLGLTARLWAWLDSYIHPTDTQPTEDIPIANPQVCELPETVVDLAEEVSAAAKDAKETRKAKRARNRAKRVERRKGVETANQTAEKASQEVIGEASEAIWYEALEEIVKETVEDFIEQTSRQPELQKIAEASTIDTSASAPSQTHQNDVEEAEDEVQEAENESQQLEKDTEGPLVESSSISATSNPPSVNELEDYTPQTTPDWAQTPVEDRVPETSSNKTTVPASCDILTEDEVAIQTTPATIEAWKASSLYQLLKALPGPVLGMSPEVPQEEEFTDIFDQINDAEDLRQHYNYYEAERTRSKSEPLLPACGDSLPPSPVMPPSRVIRSLDLEVSWYLQTPNSTTLEPLESSHESVNAQIITESEDVPSIDLESSQETSNPEHVSIPETTTPPTLTSTESPKPTSRKWTMGFDWSDEVEEAEEELALVREATPVKFPQPTPVAVTEQAALPEIDDVKQEDIEKEDIKFLMSRRLSKFEIVGYYRADSVKPVDLMTEMPTIPEGREGK